MSTDVPCPRCGELLRPGVLNGLCPTCLGLAALTMSQLQARTETGNTNASGDLPGFILEGLSAESPPPPLGRLGEYELLERLGRGGMGTVYRARQPRLNRLVALKVVESAAIFADERALRRFQLEGSTMAVLDHPNIVPLYDVGQHGDFFFFSMKLVEGGNLGQQSTGPRSDPAAAVRVLGKIARAVHYAHQHGVIHRDLKPANILLDDAREPYIADFGVAKRVHAPSDLTLNAEVLGTPDFVAPEQAIGGPAPWSVLVDVYGLGAILYFLLTGRPPFHAETAWKTLQAIVEREPVRLRALNARVDRDLETIVLKCLSKLPARRYASAQEVAEELDRWLKGEPILARPPSSAGRLFKWARREPALAVLGATTLLAVFGLVAGQTAMSLRLARARNQLIEANTRLAANLHDLQWQQAEDLDSAGRVGDAVARFSRFLRDDPMDLPAAARLLSLLSTRNFPLLLRPPLVHGSPVNWVEFAPSGPSLVTASQDGRARVWNWTSGEALVVLTNSQPILRASFHPGGATLLTLSNEPRVELWEAETGRRICDLGLVSRADTDLVGFSPAGRHLLLPRRRDQLILADGKTGEESVEPLLFSAPISSRAWSDDDRYLVTAGEKSWVMWDLGSRPRQGTPHLVRESVVDVTFAPRGSALAVLTRGGEVQVVEVPSGRERISFPVGDAAKLRFLADGERLVAMNSEVNDYPAALFDVATGRRIGSPYGQPGFAPRNDPRLRALAFSFPNLGREVTSHLRLVDSTSGRPTGECFVHDGPVTMADFSADGRTLATASQDGTVRLWDLRVTAYEGRQVSGGSSVWDAQWSPTGDRIAITSGIHEDTRLHILDARSGETTTFPAAHDNYIPFVVWSPDGTRLATASEDQTARIWDARTGAPLSEPLRHDRRLNHCAFSPDGRMLATAGEDTLVRLWDGVRGSPLGSPLPHSSAVVKVSFSHDGNRMATACLDGTARIWSLDDHRLLAGPMRHRGVCWVAAFSSEGERLVTASSDFTAQVWATADGRPVVPALRHDGPVWWAEFRRDGRALVTSTEQGLVRVWDPLTGGPISRPMRHPGGVWYAHWSPDGRRLATTCTDGAARLWDAVSGLMLAEPVRHAAEVRRAEFSPDGRRLLSASRDGGVKVVSLFVPPIPVPSWFPDLAESTVGKRITWGGVMEPAPVEAEKVAFLHRPEGVADPYYQLWREWFLTGRRTKSAEGTAEPPFP